MNNDASLELLEKQLLRSLETELVLPPFDPAAFALKQFRSAGLEPVGGSRKPKTADAADWEAELENAVQRYLTYGPAELDEPARSTVHWDRRVLAGWLLAMVAATLLLVLS